jgi:hypothetical protein
MSLQAAVDKCICYYNSMDLFLCKQRLHAPDFIYVVGRVLFVSISVVELRSKLIQANYLNEFYSQICDSRFSVFSSSAVFYICSFHFCRQKIIEMMLFQYSFCCLSMTT